MKKGRKSWLVALAATAVLMTACGGGGGGGGDNSIAAAAYNGVSTQTYLNANNAEALVQGAYGGLDYQSIIPLATGDLGVTGVSAANTINPYHLSTLTQKTVAILKQDFQVKPLALLDPATACSNYPAGTVTDSVVESSSNTTTTVKGNITFSNCDLGGGVIFDGNMGISMSMNLDTSLFQLSMTMNPLNVSDGVTTYTLNGEMNTSETIDNSGFLVSHLTLNVTLKEPTGQTFWLNNYKIDDTEESSGTRSTVSGRYYENNYGFVDFSTIETIYVPFNSAEATYDGLIEFVGREGTHANLWLGVNQNDYCINVFNASGTVSLGTCAQ